MKLYDAIIILNPALSEDKLNASIAKFEKKIKDAGAVDMNIARWGMKKLANKIRKLKNGTEGYYVLISFNGESNTPTELRSLLNVSEEVIRYAITLTKEAKPIIEEKVEIEPSMIEKSGEMS